MNVTVSILGASQISFENKMIELSDASTLNGLAAELIHAAEVFGILIDKDGNLRRHLVIQVNKKRVLPSKATEFILADGDDVVIYLPVSGG